jgi:uncharacterized membrane protein YkvA (DUF1232 family)
MTHGNDYGNGKKEVLMNTESKVVKNESTKTKKVSAWVFLGLVLIYLISPIDAIPDIIPALGWADDGGLLMVAILNFVQQLSHSQGSLLIKAIKYLKWILIIAILAFMILIICLIKLSL